jgi:hypothetical protein
MLEPTVLNVGLYNLGFIAVRRSEETDKFLQWWMIKLKKQCVIDLKNGLFVDQLWINFVPVYYEKVLVLKHPGYNMAYWNLHERTVTRGNKGYTVNDRFPLVFFHFSGFNFNKPDSISKYQLKYSFEQRPDLAPLFEEYRKMVLHNRFEHFSKLPCAYVQLKQKWEAEQKILEANKTSTAEKMVRVLKRKTKNIVKAVIS